MKNLKHHLEWLSNWKQGIILWLKELALEELAEAKDARCDFCIREIRKELKKYERSPWNFMQ